VATRRGNGQAQGQHQQNAQRGLAPKTRRNLSRKCSSGSYQGPDSASSILSNDHNKREKRRLIALMLWGTVVYLFCLISIDIYIYIWCAYCLIEVSTRHWLMWYTFMLVISRSIYISCVGDKGAGDAMARWRIRSSLDKSPPPPPPPPPTTSEVRTNALKLEQNVSLKLAPWAGGKDARTARPQLRCASIHTYDVSG
jgi:hypothetical protein